jgi:urate oxidase
VSLAVRSAAYGKSAVKLCRTVRPRPGSGNASGAVQPIEIDVELTGGTFLAAYTDGDNRSIVATDSIRNLVVAVACARDDWTLEPVLDDIACRIMGTYPQIERIRVFGRRPLLDRVADGVHPVLRRWGRRAAVAELELARRDGPPRPVAAVGGITGLRLLRLGGSSFSGFVQDEYTTLPEDTDRDLWVDLDVRWRTGDAARRIRRPIEAETAEEVIQDVVAGFDSRSIQHLLGELGRALLERFPGIGRVALEGRNRGWTPVRTASDDTYRTYVESGSAYGLIKLEVGRE